jgi:hypothetical protein
LSSFALAPTQSWPSYKLHRFKAIGLNPQSAFTEQRAGQHFEGGEW